MNNSCFSSCLTHSICFTESPSDYRAVSKLVTMPPCQTLKCEAVVIVNDVVLEETETFSIGLYRTANLDPRIILAPVNSTVQIVDRDSTLMFV